jgi:hypothetical protein
LRRCISFSQKGDENDIQSGFGNQRRVFLKAVVVTSHFGVIRSVLASKPALRELSVVLFTCAALTSMACEPSVAGKSS